MRFEPTIGRVYFRIELWPRRAVDVYEDVRRELRREANWFAHAFLRSPQRSWWWNGMRFNHQLEELVEEGRVLAYWQDSTDSGWDPYRDVVLGAPMTLYVQRADVPERDSLLVERAHL